MANIDSTPKPFRIGISQETCDWVKDRVRTARVIPDLEHPEGREWADGVPTSVMEELLDYWRDSYDWRKVEDKINSTFQMFTVDLEESGENINLHFVHHVSKHDGAIPLLFAHGWPGNFLEVESLLKLTDPVDPAQQAFHIIAPSIPGFVFSSAPKVNLEIHSTAIITEVAVKAPGFTVARIASIYHKLMTTLGYTHYIGQGGDWGSFILRAMAISFPGACIGIHLNFVLALPPSPLRNPITLFWLVLRWFTPDQKKRLGRMQWWMKEESGYSRIQGTKPQTISYALMDSPLGMLAWIREKLESLSEPDFVWKKEVIVTWTMLYILSGSASHARIYKEGISTVGEEVLQKTISKEVAFGASCFPRDVAYIPRWWAQGTVAENIVFWREHTKGGHFPSVECGDVLEGDLRDFVKAMDKGGSVLGGL